jgi:short-chain fatty acids transporter
LSKVAGFFTELMRRYLPDPFVFAIGLTLLTMVMAMLVEGQAAQAVITNWGKGSGTCSRSPPRWR